MLFRTIISLLLMFINITFIGWIYTHPKLAYVNFVSNTIIERYVEVLDTYSAGSLLRKGSYPININVGKLNENVLGTSISKLNHCEIVIDEVLFTDLKEKLFQVLAHEIAHCYGFYLHDSNPKSLMYYASNDITFESITDFYMNNLNKQAHNLLHWTF